MPGHYQFIDVKFWFAILFFQHVLDEVSLLDFVDKCSDLCYTNVDLSVPMLLGKLCSFGLNFECFFGTNLGCVKHLFGTVL